MSTFEKRFRMGATAGVLTLLLAAPPALAQTRVRVPGSGIQPFFPVAPGLTLPQATYNINAFGSAYANFPPYAMGFAPSYALGYNPTTAPLQVRYQGPFANGLFNPFLNPFLNGGAGTNPFLGGTGFAPSLYANPYFGGSGGYGTAALTSTGGATNSGYDLSSLYSNPYSGGGYGGYGYPDPNAGYLHGAGDVINAQGRFRLSTRQADLLSQQIEREKIENRRRWVDEYLWEREHLPTAEDERERAQRMALRRSINDPPVNEILSSTALNRLLDNLEKQSDKGNATVNVPLDESMLQRINVTSPQGGNVGLLRNGGKLSWPVALRGADFQRDREKLEALVPDAIALAKEGKIDAASLTEMRTSIERMRQQLSADLKDLTPDQGIESKRYLNNLDQAVRALERSDAGNLLRTDGWAARGATVADLVRNMKEKGLVFAPSVGGDETAYLALHRALATYSAALDNSLQTQTAEKEKAAP